ncbi:hypothetical protein [Bradyrhizobium viridifuturi]|uniref:hypothetical protein n=1 Tax=Bradyrhizobium viridifuturi TaxID=1654716 RepID=UPI000FE14B63|nr:hypothetical protein [Bradyrhizobium viridifuturi]
MTSRLHKDSQGLLGYLRTDETAMDAWTKSLLGATVVAIVGYFAIVYGGCALDPGCHLRTCYGHRACGVIYDKTNAASAH